ncbi:uncharacterized protein LOC110843162 [Folsomia candida]|uniref:uncharacterized protein LOC110843162 n=1 Tax=Folsomia candida TaxID=158441 RepID=UPI000B8F434A|nr:uncharacterized protein LOC110843162 [Folsomia candida]
MRFLIVAAAVAVLGSVSAGTVLHRPTRGLVDEATWKVESESDDHITYVRKPLEPAPTGNVDCNLTTTATPPAAVPRRRSGSSRWRPEVRSGVEESARRKSSRGRTSSQAISKPNDDGDHLWSISHRTDDQITYTRRGSSGHTQGQPGELRRLGSGRDAVLARVVVPGKEDEYTEEALIEGVQPQGSRHTGYPTNELVHPYVKKPAVSATSSSRSSNRTKSLRTTSRGGKRQLKSQTTSSTPPNIEPSHEDHPPRVGEVVNGWVVISKSKDHISWERWGSTSSSSRQASSSASNAAAVANLQARNSQNENRLRSLKSLRSGSSAGRQVKTQRNKLIPSAEGELIEGFPRIFNTYSRAFYVNERNVDEAGSIRTSLSDTSNWNVGDELAGWKVISKDHRGIVWQRMPLPQTSQNGNVLNEEDLLDELNKKKGGQNEEESSESDSSSESKSNEDDNIYRGPPGTWYLSNETKNSITWSRDNTPADLVFEMNAFPRIGDTQSGWKVRSKSRDHITWVRLNNDGSEADSNEQQ